MKTTIKKGYAYILAIFLMATIGTIYAFSNAKAKESDAESFHKKNQPTLVWYQYQLNTFLEGQVKSAANYNRVSSEPGCNATENICAIQLEDTGLHPNLSTALQNDLWDAQQHIPAPAPNIKMQQ